MNKKIMNNHKQKKKLLFKQIIKYNNKLQRKRLMIIKIKNIQTTLKKKMNN